MDDRYNHPLCRALADEFRTARASFERAAKLAADMHRPEMDFSRNIRLLGCMAECVENGQIWKAYVYYPELTDAPKSLKIARRKTRPRSTEERRSAVAKKNGASGGRSVSLKKQEAARANGKLGGRPGKDGIRRLRKESEAARRARLDSAKRHCTDRFVIDEAERILDDILLAIKLGEKPWALDQIRAYKLPEVTQFAISNLLAKPEYSDLLELLRRWKLTAHMPREERLNAESILNEPVL